MPDLLVNLLRLPALDPKLAELEAAGVVIRRAQPFELSKVRAFVEHNFSVSWADETSVGLGSQPVTVFIAVNNRSIIGFGAYECTRKAFFGPTGVLEGFRGRGVGAALLIACLTGLRELGYVYGIIGGVGPVEFYEKTVGAIAIPDSEPGIYTNPLEN